MRVSLSTLALLSTIRQAGCTDLDESLIEMANPGTSQESVQELFRKLLDIKGEFSNFFLNAEEDTEKSRGFLSRFDEIAKQISELDRPDDAESIQVWEMARSYLDNIKHNNLEKKIWYHEKGDVLDYYYIKVAKFFKDLLNSYYIEIFASLTKSYNLEDEKIKECLFYHFGITEEAPEMLKKLRNRRHSNKNARI